MMIAIMRHTLWISQVLVLLTLLGPPSAMAGPVRIIDL
jgi:hypothetical protein